MALGFKSGTGEWIYRTFTVTSTSTLSPGTAVAYAAARTVSEYSGGQAGILGFITHDSMNSLPAGKVVVAIPGRDATAWLDVPSNLAASALSAGESYGIYKVGNLCSFITDAAYSAASRCVTSTGVYDSTLSRIEVTINSVARQFPSHTSTNIG